MNPTYSYKDYRTHICNYWLSKLGGKEMIEKGTCESFLGSRQESNDSTGEAVLYTESKKGIFKGKCRKCGQVGYNTKDCKSERKKFTGKCNWCQKQGHKEAQCWAKKRGDPKTPGPIQNGNNNGSNTNNVQVCQPVMDETEGMFAGNTFC